MKNVIGYLKAEVIVEPLINQWYAWSYLIPPATASRYLTESHLKVMQSFVDAPEVHETTLCNPAMRGGPFIQYSASRVEEVRSLLVKTKTEQTRLLALSDAIAHLRSQLADHPAGQSLEPLYAHIPEPLKGYVELVYDAHNSASIRLIEGLLYRSEYYNSASQSIALRLADCDQRAFVMSTPRLPDSNSLFLSIPFADSRLDDLFQMRYKAGSVEAIATRLTFQNKVNPFSIVFLPPRLCHITLPTRATASESAISAMPAFWLKLPTLLFSVIPSSATHILLAWLATAILTSPKPSTMPSSPTTIKITSCSKHCCNCDIKSNMSLFLAAKKALSLTLL